MYNTDNEIWVSIRGYKGLYQVSNMGRVKSMKRVCKTNGRVHYTVSEKIRKYSQHNQGYVMVTLSKKGVNRIYLVHRIVAKSFIPNADNLPEINHKNGVKYDNRIENLEWCTSSENQQHAFDTGLQKPLCGERVSYKLKDKDVFKIRELYANGASAYSIAKKYNLSQAAAQNIVNNKSWKHLLNAV